MAGTELKAGLAGSVYVWRGGGGVRTEKWSEMQKGKLPLSTAGQTLQPLPQQSTRAADAFEEHSTQS